MPARAVLVVLTTVVLLALAPTVIEADLPCPQCGLDEPAALTASHVIDLVLTTVLQHGVSVLLGGAALVVGIPWAIAGVAVAAMGWARARAD